ncbi:MAG: ABC transporter substrate-binding protein, partial [Simkaniaceae bacterium]|nr:ABC transporter substrate-binding protein [Simkaniaceae bacterium]
NQIILRLVEAFREITQSNPEQAAYQLSFVYPEYVPDELFPVYEQLILASYKEKSTIVTIGIVAPLTGLESIAGRTFLRGIQQAFKHHLRVGHKVSYIILDNLSDEIETARAMTSLLKNPNVTAIIAPLGRRDALMAASMVNNSTIPVIIPLSTQDGLTDLSPNVFQFNSTLSMRGEFAAQYAIQNLQATSIAILAPADGYGKTLVDAFIKELDLNGIEPVAIEWYSDDPKNLKREFTAIRKSAWALVPDEDTNEQYLGMELDSLDALFDVSTEDFFDLPEEENKKKLSRSDSTEVVLETVQAIFIPAHPAHISYIGTQFPVYNLNTTIIGTESWYNPDVLNQETIGPHINGMVLVSSEYPNERIDEVLPENVTNPSVFYLGYDTAEILLHIAAKTYNDPSGFSRELSSVASLHGKFHSFSFGKSHKNVNTALHILKYENERFYDLGFFRGDSLVATYYPAP